MTTLQKTKALMQEYSISAYRLSKMTGLSESTLSRWFAGKTDIKMSNYEKIEKALNTLLKEKSADV